MMKMEFSERIVREGVAMERRGFVGAVAGLLAGLGLGRGEAVEEWTLDRARRVVRDARGHDRSREVAYDSLREIEWSAATGQPIDLELFALNADGRPYLVLPDGRSPDDLLPPGRGAYWRASEAVRREYDRAVVARRRARIRFRTVGA